MKKAQSVPQERQKNDSKLELPTKCSVGTFNPQGKLLKDIGFIIGTKKEFGWDMSHGDILWVEKWVDLLDLRSIGTHCGAWFLEQWGQKKTAKRSPGTPVKRF